MKCVDECNVLIEKNVGWEDRWNKLTNSFQSPIQGLIRYSCVTSQRGIGEVRAGEVGERWETTTHRDSYGKPSGKVLNFALIHQYN